MLVDGGILNNLPLNVARDAGSGYNIVVAVSSIDEFRAAHGDLPSVWAYFKERLLSPTKVRNAPTLQRVVIKSTMLGSRRESAAAREQADLLISPSTQEFDLQEWNGMFDICDVGYLASREQVIAWAEDHPETVQHEEFLDSC